MGSGSQHHEVGLISSCRSPHPCRTLEPIALPDILPPVPDWHPILGGHPLGRAMFDRPISVDTFKFKASSGRADCRRRPQRG